MGKQLPAEQFAKFCAYILGRRPDEFGLVPDADGYVKIKEFIKAVSETEGWGHIRRASLNEMLLVCPGPPVEITADRIRAADRSQLPERTPCPFPPKLLYTCIRQKAYPVVLEKGIAPTHQAEVLCTENEEMAIRIGRRRSGQPVCLTIHTARAKEYGVSFSQAGEGLYTTDFIPPECFSGPPLPKEPEKPAKPEKPEAPPQPGSFAMSPEAPKNKPAKSKPKWKKNKKRGRKDKKHIWPDEY
ncbi:MAG: hypothetical protein R6X08_00890 [Desulfosalsimonadaceae bacterium]